jgi:hypothetical protein
MTIRTPKDTQDWFWDASIMEDEKTKEELRNSPFASLELVYQVVWSLARIIDSIEDGAMVMISLICDTKDAWDATNFARLWPEREHPKIDTRLQDALAHIADAHYMIEDTYVRKGHLTQSASHYSVNDLKHAVNILDEVYIAIDHYINDKMEGIDEDD